MQIFIRSFDVRIVLVLAHSELRITLGIEVLLEVGIVLTHFIWIAATFLQGFLFGGTC